MQTSAVAKIWNKSDPDSNSDFRINLDPDVPQNCGYTRRRHSFRQVFFSNRHRVTLTLLAVINKIHFLWWSVTHIVVRFMSLPREPLVPIGIKIVHLLGFYVKIVRKEASGEISSSQFLFWDPSIYLKLMQLGSWNLVHWSSFEGTMATCKNLSARGRLGRAADPAFYFGTPSISPKLMELGSWNFVQG